MSRTAQEEYEHYEIEKELAAQLLNSKKEDRCHLYTEVYDQLFLRVPHHPMLTLKQCPSIKEDSVNGQVRLLKNFVKPSDTYLEVGPGDCSVAIKICDLVSKVYAVDVSEELTKGAVKRDNFELIISDGTSIPVPPNSVNVVFSNQLMEHLHPDDAVEQLRNIYNALVVGGTYLCITPNSTSGPHDISRNYNDVAEGFHLKEYNYKELSVAFREAGFSKVKVNLSAKGIAVKLPVFPFIWLESFLWMLPGKLRKRVSRQFLIDKLLGIDMIGEK